MKTIRLNDATPQGFTGSGIFSRLQLFDVPWADLEIAAALDAEYYGNISGDKIISPAADKLLDSDGELSADALQMLATVAFSVFGTNWAKMWATLSAEYDPIQNYNMIEQMTDDETVIDYGHTRTGSSTSTGTKTGTETDAPNLTHKKTGTEKETPAVTVETDNQIFGFNSGSGVDSDKQKQTSSGTSTTTYDTTDTDSGQTVKTYDTRDGLTGSDTQTEGGTDTHTRNYTLTRKGNIGVTTTQQMLQSERELWIWNYFYAVVFPDVDRVLTIDTY